ncbi:MAG: ABC transporter ATP-binding protein [Solobacterium sp.]|nr:ABC transporter ATP-binding protein [Solobacterium sp.]
MGTLKKLLQLLDGRQRKQLYLLFFMMLIGAGLEVISVSMIVPVAALLLQSDPADLKIYTLMQSLFHLQTREQFVYAGIGILLVLVIFKTVYLLWEYRLQYRFVYDNKFAMQKKMLHAFLLRPYEYYLNAGTGEILRMIQGDVSLAFDILFHFLSLATDLIISVLLTVTVFIISPLITTAVAVSLLLIVIMIVKILKPRQHEQGSRRNALTAQISKWLLQSVNGIREIRISGTEAYFEENYDRYGREAADIDRSQAVLKNTPKLLIEMVCICSVLLIMAVLTVTGMPADQLILQLSALIMAAVKLMPCANRITNAMNIVAYGTPAVEKAAENLQILKEGDSRDRLREPAETIPFTKEICFEHVSYRYPDTETDVLHDISLVIRRGDRIGIIGASGAGKTTFIDILTSLLTPYEGKIMVDGREITADDPAWLSHIGYIPQDIFVLDDSVSANVAFGCAADMRDESKIRRVLSDAQLLDYIDSLPAGLDTRLGERGSRLSGGQIQRLGIARALYSDPDILILDEATSALDTVTERSVMKTIDDLPEDKTVIVISHRAGTVANCQRIFEIKDKTLQIAERGKQDAY